MQDAKVEFGDGEEGRMKRDEFAEKCKDPKFVAECLREYQMWRKGKGKYGYDGDPEEYVPVQPPFCAEALSIVEDAAIEIITDCGKIIDDIESESGDVR